MAHPHIELLQRLFAAFAAHDLDAIGEALHADVVWETAGRSRLAGRRVGVGAVLSQLARSSELSGGTYRIEVEDIAAGEDHAVVLYRGHATVGGRAASFGMVNVYAIADGRITSVQAVPVDLYAFDEFWS
jgi:ketosteroid isomerase-like protein